MRGEIVLVRAFGGKPLKRRVWDVGASVVYVTNDDSFDKLNAGEISVMPIGFPKEDVFQYSDEDSLSSINWSRLMPLHGGQLSMFPGEPSRSYPTRQSHKPFKAKGKHFSSSTKGNTNALDSQASESGLLPGMAISTL